MRVSPVSSKTLPFLFFCHQHVVTTAVMKSQRGFRWATISSWTRRDDDVLQVVRRDVGRDARRDAPR